MPALLHKAFSHLFFFFCTFEREIRPTKAELHVESHVAAFPRALIVVNRTHRNSR